MINNFEKFINEKLGYLESLLDVGNDISDSILEFLKEKGDNEIEIINGYKFGLDNIIELNVFNDIQINEFKISKIRILVKLYINNNYDHLVIAGLSVSNSNIETDTIKSKYIYDYNNESLILIQLVNNSMNITYNDIFNVLKKSELKITSSITHELKHIYDNYKISSYLNHDVAKYNVFSNRRFNIQPIDSFLYYLYITSKMESRVRNTELAQIIKKSDVTKSEFERILNEQDIIKYLKDAKNFNFDNDVRKELLERIDRIKSAFDHNNIDYKGLDDKEIIEKFLDIIFLNLKNEILNITYDLSKPKNLFDFFKNIQVDEYVSKISEKGYYSSKERFFDYCEKNITFDAEKSLKKISKLYDMCKDDEDKDNINTKINKKVMNKNESKMSIINPKVWNDIIANPKIIDFSKFIKKK